MQGLLIDDIREIAPEAYARRIRRSGTVDAWTHAAFRLWAPQRKPDQSVASRR